MSNLFSVFFFSAEIVLLFAVVRHWGEKNAPTKMGIEKWSFLYIFFVFILFFFFNFEYIKFHFELLYISLTKREFHSSVCLFLFEFICVNMCVNVYDMAREIKHISLI